MALIKCPECTHNVSDKAISCPNCGYPINMPTSTKPRIRNGKPTKLPNGYGTIYKMSGNRSKPYRAVKTNGWILDANGKSKQERFTIGYYSTREEAMIGLANYNENPYDVSINSVTFEEIYNIVLSAKEQTMKPASLRSVIMAFNHSTSLHKMRIKDIRPYHMEDVYTNCSLGASNKDKLITLFHYVFEYALSNDLVEKDYSRLIFPLGKPNSKETKTEKHKSFTDEEIEKLWNSLDIVPFADMVLIGIYSGWRPQELSILQLENIDLEKGIMQGGLKTDAGRDRIVPIHPYIKPLIEKRYKEALSINSTYLFNDISSLSGKEMTYDKYRKRFEKVMNYHKFNNTPHDTRHTFISLAKQYKLDEYILKLIVGHSINDITEKVYTHRTIEQLKEEMEKITKKGSDVLMIADNKKGSTVPQIP